MKGFFTAKETESITRPDGKVYSCAACGLSNKVNSPKMKPYGNFKKGILNIGVSPSLIDDKKGKPWQNEAGKYLTGIYDRLGIDIFEDCLNTYSSLCYNDSQYTVYQLNACKKWLFQVIKEYKPKVVVLFGWQPLLAFLNIRWKKDLHDLHKWRGFIIPDLDFKTYICPVFDPDYVYGVVNKRKEVETIWKQDIKNALNVINKPFFEYKEPTIKVISDLGILQRLTNTELIAFDYETTCLRPQLKGARIVCASVAYSSDEVYVFLMPETRSEREPFTKLLSNPNIGKMAHNIKFEQAWSMVRLKQPVINWQWDSMIAAHILDNRPKITGLKFQSYIRFGIGDYSSEIASYLSSDKGSDLNNVLTLMETEGGHEKLLTYCALDSIYEYRLAHIQMKELDYNLLPF